MIELVVPPLLGAVIGYFTNLVAIKMLFKPVRPYYLFGRRIPFTPGLIPSKREKLADAIAKVVRENLLTEEVLRKRLNEEKVRRSLEELVGNFLDSFSQNPDRFISGFISAFEEKRLGEVLNLKNIDEKAEKVIDSLLESLNGKEVGELLPPGLKVEFERLVDEKLEELVETAVKELEKPEFREVLYSVVRSNTERLKSYLPFVPDSFFETVSLRLSRLLEELIEKAAKDPDFRLKISKILWEKSQDLMKVRLNTKGSTGRKLGEFLKELLRYYGEDLSGRRLGEIPAIGKLVREDLAPFLGKLVKEKKGELSSVVSDKMLKIIEEELPVVMEALDVENLVREKVNSMPIEEIEEIVLKIIEEELRYITLLGGFLGALIGLFQIPILL